MDAAYPVMVLQSNSSILRLDILDTINLAFVRTIHDDHSVLGSEIELPNTTSPRTSMLNKLGPCLMQTIVGPVLSHRLLKRSVVVESQVSLRRQGSHLPVLSSCLPGILQVLPDFGDSAS